MEQVQHDQGHPVAAVGTAAAAQLLVATLQVHDVVATTVPTSVYPSLDFVDGLAVSVAADDVERARELLTALGHEPLPR